MKAWFASLFCALALTGCNAASPSAGPESASGPDSSSAAPVLPTESPSATTAPSETTSGCTGFTDHAYEVCTAYVFNASIDSRLPFYKLGRSTAVGYYRAVQENCTGRRAGPAATCRMESRYYGDARQMLLRQTAGWPAEVDVEPPRISIVRVDVSGDSAVLRTSESWSVTTTAGRTLFAESHAQHTVHMIRTQGLILHKWVVTQID